MIVSRVLCTLCSACSSLCLRTKLLDWKGRKTQLSKEIHNPTRWRSDATPASTGNYDFGRPLSYLSKKGRKGMGCTFDRTLMCLCCILLFFGSAVADKCRTRIEETIFLGKIRKLYFLGISRASLATTVNMVLITTMITVTIWIAQMYLLDFNKSWLEVKTRRLSKTKRIPTTS